MNRGRLRALIASLLVAIMSLIILPAHSASLAGTKCTKSGLTKIVSNTKFTCVKSGNKLIWNKAVAAKPSIANQNKPTSSPTPEIPYSKFTEPERKVYLAMEKIVKSWEPFLSAMDNKTVTLITENSTHLRNEPNRISVEVSTEVIKSMMPFMIKPTYYTYETAEWADQQMAKVCPNMVGRNPVGTNGGAQVGCGRLVTANLNGWNNKVAGIDGSWFEAAHETFHIAEIVSADGEGKPATNAWYPNTPAWYREGSASTFGGLIRVLMKKGKIDYSELNSFERSPTSYLECKRAWEIWQESNSATDQFELGQCEYGLGRRMTDYLVAMHGGIAGILKNYELVGQGKSFDEAFKTAHGITVKEFFEEAKPFLSAQGFRIS